MRANGTREIGPNATLVTGPFVYEGMSSSVLEFFRKIFERPIIPKLKLFTNRKFLSLAWDERNSSAKHEMCKRVQEFIPALSTEFLDGRGLAGVRSSLIDPNGFVPEAIVVEGEVVPRTELQLTGATGAPAYSAFLIGKMKAAGFLDGFAKKNTAGSPWSFDMASDFEALSRERNLKR